jgi:uncharacterized membrane protein
MKRTLTREATRIFITGLVAVLPLLATLAFVVWAISLLWSWLGPNSPIGGALVKVGIGVTGSELVGYLMGVVLVVAAIFGLGLVVEAGFQRGLARLVNTVMQRIPVVRTVYDLAHRMVKLLAQREADGTKSMRPVWCHFGGVGGSVVLALLSTPTPVMIGERAYMGVLIPTAPVPIGGGLLYVPEEWVTPADVGMEGVTSLYVSMGVTSNKYLKAARQSAAEIDQMQPISGPRDHDQPRPT